MRVHADELQVAARPGGGAPPPAARPSASPKPNLLSCWPVWTKSCVLGRTPGVTRTSTSWTRPRAGGRRLQPLDLLERVDDEVADAGVEAGLDLGHRLVVAVEVDALRREAGGAGGGQLAAGGDVQRQALLRDQLAIARQLNALLA